METGPVEADGLGGIDTQRPELVGPGVSGIGLPFGLVGFLGGREDGRTFPLGIITGKGRPATRSIMAFL